MKLMKYFIYSAAIVSVLSAAAILLLYGNTFHWKLSSLADDWGSFGSLLGGCFTLIGALVTTITFILLRDQQELTAKALQKQIDSLTFEQYRQHKDEFTKLVEDRTRNGCLSIPNAIEFYQRIFPRNNPTEVTLRASTTSMDGLPSVLGRSIKAIEKILLILDGHLQQTPTQNLATLMQQTISTLGLKHSKHFNPYGKVTNPDTGIFFYLEQLGTQIHKIEELITEIAFFGGLHYEGRKIEVIDWRTPTLKYLELLIEKDQYKSTLDPSSRGAIGLIKLSRSATSEQLRHFKNKVNETLHSDKFLNTLQPTYSLILGGELAKNLKSTEHWSEIQDNPEILQIKNLLVDYLNYPPHYW
ncbi:hypothetical protein LZ838_09480 [Pseudomonas sp. AA27]|uniref:hypothetical protein n=1 Tax=Pseudomonas sp. AA27 TaxID=2908652 RepID=UPI001F3D8262|nr:hypothetical protein [Pseudomonas sp. AA27]MCF1487592.1 hypothetical protein [Pseudomonas sp. AA27]